MVRWATTLDGLGPTPEVRYLRTCSSGGMFACMQPPRKAFVFQRDVIRNKPRQCGCGIDLVKPYYCTRAPSVQSRTSLPPGVELTHRFAAPRCPLVPHTFHPNARNDWKDVARSRRHRLPPGCRVFSRSRRSLQGSSGEGEWSAPFKPAGFKSIKRKCGRNAVQMTIEVRAHLRHPSRTVGFVGSTPARNDFSLLLSMLLLTAHARVRGPGVHRVPHRQVLQPLW